MGTVEAPLRRPRRVALGWAFVERQGNLWRRYWAWEAVWVVYGVVNTLAITFIADEAARTGVERGDQLARLTLFLLVGTLVWAYLSAVLDDMSLVILWERWEGTIEHTLMAPVPRVVHLFGMSAFAVAHAFVRTALVLILALPFFSISFAHTSWTAAAAVVLVGSVSLVGLGILAAILPLLYPERGEQMTMMVQAAILLVSGVYYGVDVLPGWLQAVSGLSPATYLLRGIRSAVIDGRGVSDQAHNLLVLGVLGVVLVPASVAAFALAERWAKTTGRLKRQG